MKLKVLDQINVSAIRSETLRAGETVDVGDSLGEDLLRRLPRVFARVEGEKQEPPPRNKSDTRRRTKAAPAARD